MNVQICDDPRACLTNSCAPLDDDPATAVAAAAVLLLLLLLFELVAVEAVVGVVV